MKHCATIVSAILLVTACVSPLSAQDDPEFPELPKPQKEHEWLTRFVGEWDSVAEAFMGPDQPPVRAEGTQRARMLGGFWMIAEGQSEMMGTPVQSILTLGYDAQKSKFVGTWTDSCQDTMWVYEGKLSEDGTTLTLHTQGPSFNDPDKTAEYREVIEFKDQDHYVFSSMVQGEDGQWLTFVTANFRRK